jgi:diguanylate cyclase (GGDEF)-like protein
VLVVAGDGTIEAAYGGFGGFLGLDLDALAGTSVFDHVAGKDTEELAMYFIENVSESADTIALPMPFRLDVIDPDGFAHPVDIIPTGRVGETGEWRWTVLLVPMALNGSIVRSLDLEMKGAPRIEVRKMLCEELVVENANYTSRWVLVDLEHPDTPTVITSRDEDADVVAAVHQDIVDRDWAPWESLLPGQTAAIDFSTIPQATHAVMDERGWQRSIVAPVFVRDRVVAAFILLGRVPPEYPANDVKVNVAARVQALARATALLFERWEDQDRLQLAATTDSLTGLTNRRSLLLELTEERRGGSLLYVDVDDFKSINDNHGHEVGDRVLVTIADRITASCRAEDTVGRVGGDEFVILLHGADDELASSIARRMIESVNQPLAIAGGPSYVSVSIGRASLDEGNPLDIADRRMLIAKRSRVTSR